MLLKCSHVPKNHAAQLEERHAPFDRLFNIRAGLVGKLTNVRQDRLRERLRLRNIGVNLRIELLIFHDSSLHQS
jgi:hypothetical protein